MQQKIKIAIAQVGSVLADVDKNLENHYRLIEQAIDAKCQIIQFPELSVTGYSLKDAVFDVACPADDPRYDKLKDLSRHIIILAGTVERDKRFEVFNSLFYFEDGDLLARHRKVYLPTYGLFEEKRYFSAGNRFRAFDGKWGRVGMMICEDMWHSTSGVILAQDGASVIFVSSAGVARGLSNDSRPEVFQDWESLNHALAIHSTSYMSFANRVGVEDGLMFWGGSELNDPYGHRLAKAAYFEEELLFGQIDLLRLKHARINTTLLGDENLNVVVEELQRIHNDRKNY